jgi:hypothetical protein
MKIQTVEKCRDCPLPTYETIRAEAKAEALQDAAARAEMALAVMFDMGEITKSKAVSIIRAAIKGGE